MSSSLARITGFLCVSVFGLGLAPAGAEIIAQTAAGAAHVQPQDGSLAIRVQSRLQQMMPGEAIEVRTANAGLVLSGQITNAENLRRALLLAEEHAPGRVSNLMTAGRLPQIDLTLQLAEMPRAVARNLSASMGMSGMFAPSAPGEAGALPGLIAALESKGVLRPIATATLTATAGRVTHLPAGSGCTGPAGIGFGIGMDVTPTLTGDGAISVTLRTCLPGKTPAEGDSTVTILLQDGQTFAVADVLPDLLRDPAAYGSALADEPTLGPLLSSADYREGRTEAMVLITARIGTSGPLLSAAPPRVPTGAGMVLVSGSETGTPSKGTAPEAFTLSPPRLK